ncbi:MAG: hypothetical protein EXR93_11345 [Gemmatimonadetes bacterium]|nr:hypothetical protein [Gemmatimonadota bacterium]
MTKVTGTPSSFPGVASEAVLAQIEFLPALDVVAGFAVGPHGAASVRARRPVIDADLVRTELEQVDALAALLRGGDALRPEPVADLDQLLALLRIPGTVADGPMLAEAQRTLVAIGIVGRDVARVAREAPVLRSFIVDLPPGELAKKIGAALESDGSVKDNASPDITRARRKVREARQRLVAFLDGLLRSLSKHAPADAVATVRNGRYVIPVLREARARVSGIVHGESGSGATLFVEPTAAVEQGNDLAEAEGDEARAILALFRSLTDMLRPHVAQVESGWRMCVAVDDLYARSRAAMEWRAQRPRIDEARDRFAIRQGRHPLLIAELGLEAAVPFDLEIEPGEHVLVISGPNTGGKTVLLKAIGLCGALAQAGVIPPVGDGTTLPVFRGIFADIGDRQSIAESLSTFSAHVATLKGVLERADDLSLVLLDEMGSGTDPAEGAALAAAALTVLAKRHALTVATTHLSQLKELATTTPGVVNASLRFDGDSMRPTYELIKGVPGRSYGIAIARRLGLPADLLADAESRRSDRERSLDTLLAEMEAKSADLTRRERETLERETAFSEARVDLESLRAELERKSAELAAQGREMERSGREQARQFLLDARKRVEEALGLARAAMTEATAKEARRLIEEGVQSEAEAVKKLKEAAAAKGWTVKGQKGSLDSASREPAAAPKVVIRRPSTHDERVMTAVSEIDLRGMTGDEAESIIVRAVDDAILADLPSLRIIHGKGTGALRVRVAAILKGDTRISAFRVAPAEQGGTGVTIVEFSA